MKLNRILLKLSGESLAGRDGYGIDPVRLEHYAREIKEANSTGVQMGIVMGGGNIYRGLQGAGSGINRVQGDYMGMLATLINSMAMQSSLENLGIRTEILSGLPVDPVAGSMSSRRAIECLEDKKLVIMAGGTGRPFFTTDTTAALRALEINADALLKGTRVDGIYTSDPEKDKEATKFDTLSFDEAIDRNLKIMDGTAFTLCRENNLPVIVFDMNTKGNLLNIIKGKSVGTMVR
ncbi:MAG: UMP kinase [Bacteroidales bacterium]